MFLDSRRHVFGLFFDGSIISPHNALQVRKFINHLANQVGLAQPCGPQQLLFHRGFLPGDIRQITCNFLNPLNLFIHASQFGLEKNALESFDPVVHGFLNIAFIKELSVRKPSP